VRPVPYPPPSIALPQTGHTPRRRAIAATSRFASAESLLTLLSPTSSCRRLDHASPHLTSYVVSRHAQAPAEGVPGCTTCPEIKENG